MQKLSPWSDWLAIPLMGMGWAIAQGESITPIALAPDRVSFDIFFSKQAFGGDPPGFWSGGGLRPTFLVDEQAQIQVNGQISLPDYVLGAQRKRAALWEGNNEDPMGDSALRTGILFELALASTNLGPQIGSDLDFFLPAVTFRGYGAQEPSGDFATDGVVSAPFFYGFDNAFPRMQLPTDQTFVTDPDPAPAVTFQPNGLARLQWLVELPSTLTPGDVVEWWVLLGRNAGVDTPSPIQFNHMKYRWLVGEPFPFLPNQTVQLIGDEQQPRTDLSQYEP